MMDAQNYESSEMMEFREATGTTSAALTRTFNLDRAFLNFPPPDPLQQPERSLCCPVMLMAGMLEYHIAMKKKRKISKKVPSNAQLLLLLEKKFGKEWKKKEFQRSDAHQFIMDVTGIKFEIGAYSYPPEAKQPDPMNPGRLPSKISFLMNLMLNKGPIGVGMTTNEAWNKAEFQEGPVEQSTPPPVGRTALKQYQHAVLLKGWVIKDGKTLLILREAKGREWCCSGDALITEEMAKTACVGAVEDDIYYIYNIIV